MNDCNVAQSGQMAEGLHRLQALQCGLWRAALGSAFRRIPWSKATVCWDWPLHGCAV